MPQLVSLFHHFPNKSSNAQDRMRSSARVGIMTKSINGTVVSVLHRRSRLSLRAFLLIFLNLAPRMLQHLVDIKALGNIAVQHAADEINALFTKNEGYSKIAIHDLVDAVEWVLLVDDCVKEDAQRPYVLFFAAVWLSGKDFRGSVIWRVLVCARKPG